jgi:maltose O-acetyltransferase
MLSKVVRVFREELSGLHLRLLFARLLLWPFPIHTANRLRVFLLRAVGFEIGPKTIIVGTPIFTGGSDLYGKLKIGAACWFNVECFFDLGESITIGDRVAVGHQVIILTSSHEVGPEERRAATWYAKPVTIGDGVWLGARCTIMPGVRVGDGAIVAAGALVNRDVSPHTLVAGVPARSVKTLTSAAPSSMTGQRGKSSLLIGANLRAR